MNVDRTEAAGPLMAPGPFSTTRQAVMRPYRRSRPTKCFSIEARSPGLACISWKSI
jgi:hypothetical protein